MEQRINKFYRESRIEFRKYKKTKDTTHFAQAGQKLWNTFGMFMEVASKKEIKSFKELRKAVLDLYAETNGLVLKLFEDLYDLHKYFYRGWSEDITIEINQYLTSVELLKVFAKNYGVKLK